MDVLSILDGLRDRFRADMGVGTVYDLVDGKIYLEPSEEEGFTPPYITVAVVDVVPTRIFGDSGDVERARIQFDVWSKSESVAEGGAILQALDECYQDADFGYAASYQHMNMERTNVRVTREVPYWCFSADYILTIHEA